MLSVRVPNPIHLGLTTPALANGSYSPAVANQALYCRFRPMASVAVSAINFIVQTASGNLDVGIYADSAGAPGARLVSTGSFSCPVAGAVAKAITSLVLAAGVDYWLALVGSSTTVAVVGGGNGVRTDTFADVTRTQVTALPLPASATPAANSTYSILPVLYLSA
jgi:hypothetical protein